MKRVQGSTYNARHREEGSAIALELNLWASRVEAEVLHCWPEFCSMKMKTGYTFKVAVKIKYDEGKYLA